ncbi:oxidoreductase/nitrogenase component 1 [Methanocaldococcus vulcanius M7]|uniref:Oxidoreductase/nitrogenase component 1 n=1 Tax=Methanocaldococcus vulcanius (strain ATCC 700851 / DSM 12094 / M7) TaxID=579137 RepID=C9RGM2_METVM|nr:nitrogenase component 1 [Methanocaldococcus vulcanius]ACX72724.1 oxidoreductase/nitrogenase component 1 [Methanocaldococcus vulcanius M7]
MNENAVKVLPYKITLKRDGLPLSDKKSSPGVVNQRSCPYYGARWILAPIKNTLHIIHSPIGCAFYGQNVRKKRYTIISTDIQEADVVYGGEKKLYNTIIESHKELGGEAIFVYITCVPALIGDNIERISRDAEDILRIPVIPVFCPGFCGYHQSKGHEIAMKALFRLIKEGEFKKEFKDKLVVNIIGEYNVCNETKVIKDLLNKLGIEVIATFTGDCSVEDVKNSKNAKLNLVHCRRTGKYIANYMEDRYDIPQLKVSFIGLRNTKKSLMDIAKFFGIEDRARDVIKEEFEKIKDELEFYIKKLKGKKVGMFMGASKIGILTSAFKDLGMEVVSVGSQFGSFEDYLDAYINVDDNTILVDDASKIDLELIFKHKKPDIFVGGTKEKYMALKFGIPFLSFPQDFYPFTGFIGFLNFAREVYKAIYHPIWRMIEFKY